MTLEDDLMAEIASLLAAGEAGDDVDLLERTLTDGYATALALEADLRRLRRQIATLAGETGDDRKRQRLLAKLVRELESREGELAALRGQLAALRRRHSNAVRAARA